MFNVHSERSLQEVHHWYERLVQARGDNVPKALVGTADDRQGEKVISHGNAIRLAAKMGAPYYEVSAKTGKSKS